MKNICTLFALWLASTQVVAEPFNQRLADAALERTNHTVRYDGAYVAIPYPGGDVPADTGVCTDVVIRSYRAMGYDLQKGVHEDMRAHFSSYPSKRIWGLNKPDSNIDHRRVPNLRAFFTRHGESLNVSKNPQNYRAGDIVSWVVQGNLPHIGIVSDTINPKSQNPMIVHNIGAGPVLEDMLFDYPITGHYRYVPTLSTER